jgi:hypothetical protein
MLVCLYQHNTGKVYTIDTSKLKLSDMRDGMNKNGVIVIGTLDVQPIRLKRPSLNLRRHRKNRSSKGVYNTTSNPFLEFNELNFPVSKSPYDTIPYFF